jgi:hypothetical protein
VYACEFPAKIALDGLTLDQDMAQPKIFYDGQKSEKFVLFG